MSWNQKIFTETAAALAEESWEWLRDTHPGLATAIANDVAQNPTMKPADIRSFVMGFAGRFELAKRCELAVAHLLRQHEEP